MLDVLSRNISRGAVVAAVAFQFTAGALAQNISLEAPPGDEFRKAIAALQPDDQKAVREVVEETFPVFIFIPGIMGSKLTKTLPDGRQKVIWGYFNGIFASPDHDLAYAEGDRVKAEVLEEYYAYKKPFDIYGAAIHTIRHIDLGSGDNVRLFAYDWRQPNARSAADLSKWICEVRDTIGRRPIVFMAHSMGGLVLKHWLKNLYDKTGCGDSGSFAGWLSVRKVIFLGTPHYGAPKAINAFADQHYTLVDPRTKAGTLFGWLDANILSKSVNVYGATFPSAYELLPIVNVSKCLADARWKYPVEVRLPTGAVNRKVNLFRADVWKLFHWPRQLSDSIDRNDFVEKRLPDLLRSAEEFLCDLADFDIAKRFDVTRVFGNREETICKVVILQSDSRDRPPKIEFETCQGKGDGTVPAWIATENIRYSIDRSWHASRSHVDLLGSDEFLYYLNEFSQQLHRQMQANFLRRQPNLEPIQRMYASVRHIVPTSTAADETDEATAQVAQGVAEKLGLDTRSLFAQAMSNPDPRQRAAAYRVAADIAKPGDVLSAWALNNAAHIHWQRNDFAAAAELSGRAIAVPAGPSPATDTVMEAKGKAALTGALAARELGDLEQAKQFRDTALVFGNRKARAIRVEMPRIPRF